MPTKQHDQMMSKEQLRRFLGFCKDVFYGNSKQGKIGVLQRLEAEGLKPHRFRSTFGNHTSVTYRYSLAELRIVLENAARRGRAI